MEQGKAPIPDIEGITPDTAVGLITSGLARNFGSPAEDASREELYETAARTVRDFVYEKWTRTKERHKRLGAKKAYYISMEFLPGRTFTSNIMNLGLTEVYSEALKRMGTDLAELAAAERDPGLGSGGLGRLAACFMESLATLEMPVCGYGMRYRYGMFEQRIMDGYQVEFADMWLKDSHIWEVRNPEEAVQVRIGGEVRYVEANGRNQYLHENYYTINAVPYDVPVLGYESDTVNTLRLWSAEALEKFDFGKFTRGHFIDAVIRNDMEEQISLVLYPEDSYFEGKVLRLKQQYFLVSASIQDIVRKYVHEHGSFSSFNDSIAIQLNDTHPSLAIPELIRILLDEYDLSWDEAWKLTLGTFSYTNHTILPEALEEWPKDLLKGLFPRVYQIVEEIDRRWVEYLEKAGKADAPDIAAMSIIRDGRVRMAYLCIVCCHRINGVAELHTDILKNRVFRKFYNVFPERFLNITNGVTPRRWLLKANPGLSAAIGERIGITWVKKLELLGELRRYADDPTFHEDIYRARRTKKLELARFISDSAGVGIDPDSMFQIHCKRVHEYKRQLLSALYVMYLYNRLKEDPGCLERPRTFIFSGKAAPNYYMAKLIIKLINNISQLVNGDPSINNMLKAVFMGNFGVSVAERLYPAADVSIQISTAGKEASGTGNMKFMLNGALTIGTLDGANVEIAREVGEDNIYIFGLRSDETAEYYASGGYEPKLLVERDPRLKQLMDQLVDGTAGLGDRELFKPVYDQLLERQGPSMADPYFVIKDFGDFAAKQELIGRDFENRTVWFSKAARNIAAGGWFSSDRAVKEYAEKVWEIYPD